MDHLTPEARSANMARIGTKNTAPEVKLRKALFSLGLRYRLHRRDLPGKPDIVFPSAQTVIFVHGCFWHRHSGCKYTSFPKTRPTFWKKKFEKNIARDQEVLDQLKEAGWRSIIVWTCELRNMAMVIEKANNIASQLKENIRKKPSSAYST